ncbi:MAG: toxic anion resistance protein [Clostridia bacterium]|nr:toxic anion resistance protein [Clostridia bacterium]
MNNTPEFNLTLDPFGTNEAAQIAEAAEGAVAQQAESVEKLAEAHLSEAEKKAVAEFAEKIDISNTATVLQYGAGTQQKIANFSDSALQNVRTKDFGEVGDMVANLVGELKNFNNSMDDSDAGFFAKLFGRAKKNIDVMKAKYDKAEVSVNNIVAVLENHQVTLLKDVATLDKMYETNLTYFKELSMYILAGKQALERERTTTLVELKKKAEESGLPEDAQKANDFASMCDRFEKKIYDLELTRMVSIQMAPQIRLVQNNDTLMSEKIQSTIVNTIPLWKSQMVIALGLAHSEEALQAQRAVTDMTNELLKKNAEKLHQSTVAIAKESERGMIDIETLTHTNQELINTLDEVQQIQAEGREKRIAAEAELGRIETELKTKLLNIGQ